MTAAQRSRVGQDAGFFAALDQSGGSTPHALELYGVPPTAYPDPAGMFDAIHAMRSRIMTAPAFTGDRILGAILFADTVDRTVGGLGSAEYLWQVKHIVPFLKVDLGLQPAADDVQLMKPLTTLPDLLAKAADHGVVGTKMRSMIGAANPAGIAAIVDQQFTVAEQIMAAGLVPIIEPEVDIHSPTKAAAEGLLRDAIAARLADVDDKSVMLKLSLPSADDFYADFVDHPKVLRVVALSGGYDRAEADELLARNHGVIASFSRALAEGLTVQQTDAEFDAELAGAIDEIYRASVT